MLKEFREFINRGNVIDLAVGIVIGAAFGTVVKSFVDDVLMPPIGLAMGGVDFSELYINLSAVEYASLAAATEAGAPLIRYGLFINNLISFAIVAFAVFLVVRAYNRLRPPPVVVVAPIGKQCSFCMETVHADARRCSHCTSELGLPATAAAADR
jgi:large conductance mechanosensitive channel